MLRKLGRYYRTIKHLKPNQIRYRLWYIFRSRLRELTGYSYSLSAPQKGQRLNIKDDILKPSTFDLQSSATYTFTFLNQSKSFTNKINWNFAGYSKLWAYNLNYFDYLNQRNMGREEGLTLIQNFIDQIDHNQQGLEPYPTSLRCVNWIKFLSKNEIKDSCIDTSLYAQYQILLDNLEYHVLGNHLLENGCSLLFGAYYFRDEIFYRRAEQILLDELNEQILSDGAHFERSPMYHNIILERLLDCYNVLLCNGWKDSEKLIDLVQRKTEIMLGWLQQMAFKNGDLPHVNDSTEGIAATKRELETYATRLGLQTVQKPLGESGYRKYETANMEMLLDIGKIGPDYQPAHAHSDTLSFILYADKKPVMVDTGVSTYQANKRRELERSTEAHNTVTYGNIEQSEVWKSFRVGQRAKPNIIQEDAHTVIASHNGYKKQGVTHTREWAFRDNKIVIKDVMRHATCDSTLNLHIAPALKPVKSANDIFRVGNLIVYFKGLISGIIEPWHYAKEFNRLESGFKLKIQFKETLITYIKNNDTY